MRHLILVHEDGDKVTAEVFTKFGAAKDAFRKITTGAVSLGQLQVIKRNNHTVKSADSKGSLDKMSDDQLRAEATKRKLPFANNPTADRSALINGIQQDELNRRLTHRAPSAVDVVSPAPAPEKVEAAPAPSPKRSARKE